jgi:prolyl-tRNA synthetase
MRAERAIEVGNIFKLGTRYSEALGATYLDAEGKSHPIVMGSYGIGSGRVAATIVEQKHDDKGIIWPYEVAPYHVSLVSLARDSEEETARVADRLYGELLDAGIEVLYDERLDQSAGVKFADADLIGNPLRVTVSPRTVKAGQVELKGRTQAEPELVALDDAVSAIRAKLAALAASDRAAAGLEG